MISFFFGFCRVVTICLKQFMIVRVLFHLFHYKNKDRNHTSFLKNGLSWKWTVGLFLSRSRFYFNLDALLRCSVFCSCTPKKDPKFLYLFVIAHRHVWRIFIVPIVLLLVWLESLVSWNGPRARHQVLLSLVSWLLLGNIKAPKSLDFGIRG